MTLAEILSNPELEVRRPFVALLCIVNDHDSHLIQQLEAADLRRARWLKLQCAFERKASEGQIVEGAFRRRSSVLLPCFLS